MSRIYNFIQSQVNELLKTALINDDGEFDAGKAGSWLGPGMIPLLIAVMTSLVYILVLSVVGIYLWNNGLHVMAPDVLKPFGSGVVYKQNANQFALLFITLLAMVMFF